MSDYRTLVRWRHDTGDYASESRLEINTALVRWLAQLASSVVKGRDPVDPLPEWD